MSSYDIFMDSNFLILTEHIFLRIYSFFKKPRLYQNLLQNHRINWFGTRKVQKKKNSERYIDTGQLIIWKKEKTHFLHSANFLPISLNALLAIVFKILPKKKKRKRLISFLYKNDKQQVVLTDTGVFFFYAFCKSSFDSLFILFF